jgi:hypothetical protein
MVNEIKQNIMKDMASFDGSKEAITNMYESIKFYIKHNQLLLPDIKTFLQSKSELYIMNSMHGALNYDVVSIPKSLHFFKINAIPNGVCNISTQAVNREIFNDLKENIQTTYKNLKFQRMRKISHILTSTQDHIWEINKRPIDPNNRNPYNEEFLKHIHIPPQISEFKEGNKLLNKEFFTNLVSYDGNLLYAQDMHFASSNGDLNVDFDEGIKLQHYLMPKITCLIINGEYVWELSYRMKDIIKLLHKNNINRVIFIDLSCSNHATNNVKTTMKKSAKIERSTTRPLIGLQKESQSKSQSLVPPLGTRIGGFINKRTLKKKN